MKLNGSQLQLIKAKARRLTTLISRYKQAYIIQGALLKLSELASTISDMREFYPAIHKMVSELLHAENFYVVLDDTSNEQYQLQYFSDEKDQQYIKQVPSTAFSSGLTGYVTKTGKPLLCDKDEFDAMVANGDIRAQGSECTHWMGIPLWRDEQLIGVMAIQTYDSDYRYGDEELAMFLSIGGHTVTALDRVKSRELLELTVQEPNAAIAAYQ